MPSLAVIDTPPAPPGWEDARAHLVRIVDPLGRGVAWLAPAIGACVGFAMRPANARGTAWVHLFRPAPAPPSGGERDDAGCAVRCAVIGGAGRRAIDGWQLAERDPTAATIVAHIGADGTPSDDDDAEGLHLRLAAALTGEALALDLRAENRSRGDLQLDLGLTVGLFAPLLRDASGAVPISISAPDASTTGLHTLRLGTDDTPAVIEVRTSFHIHTPPAITGTRAALHLVAGEGPGGPLTVGAGERYRAAAALHVALHRHGGTDDGLP